MAPMGTDRGPTEEKVEHMENHGEQEFGQPLSEISTKLEQPILCAEQQKGLEPTRSPGIGVTVHDLPNEVIHEILKCLKLPIQPGYEDHTAFYSALKVCRRWRMIGIEIVYGRSTRDWSPKKWAMMYKVLKHHEAHVMKLQPWRNEWHVNLMAKRPT